MQVESTQLFKVKDVAGMFSVSRATVYRLVESGDLPALRFGAGRGSLRVTGETINASWEAARKLEGWRHGAYEAAPRLLPCAYDASVKKLVDAIALGRVNPR